MFGKHFSVFSVFKIPFHLSKQIFICRPHRQDWFQMYPPLNGILFLFLLFQHTKWRTLNFTTQTQSVLYLLVHGKTLRAIVGCRCEWKGRDYEIVGVCLFVLSCLRPLIAFHGQRISWGENVVFVALSLFPLLLVSYSLLFLSFCASHLIFKLLPKKIYHLTQNKNSVKFLDSK